MTEGHVVQHEKPMCIRIWLEVGHVCEPRPLSSLGRALALDWRVWVRGAGGHDISHFVQKVVFNLHPASAFVYPKRVLQEPPYEIQESGCTSIEIPIHIYIKNSEKPKRIKLKYTLHLENYDNIATESNCVYYDFANPSEQLKRCLLRGGGEILANTGVCGGRSENILVLITDSNKTPKHDYKHKLMKAKSYTFIEPISWKNDSKRKHRNKSTDDKLKNKIDFKRILKSVSMTDTEISMVSDVFFAYHSYEKSKDPAILLPPMTDPIYEMPELPSTLQSCLSTIELDYTLQ